MNLLVTTNDLLLGHPIRKDIFDPDGTLLLSKGTVLGSKAMIDSLLARKAEFHPDQPVVPTSQPFGKKPEIGPFELMQARCEDLKKVSFHSFDDGNAIESLGTVRPWYDKHKLRSFEVATFVGSLKSIATSVINAVNREPDSSIAAIILNVGTSYAIRHQVHSAILAVMIGKEFSLPHHHMVSLVCAALTMNLGFLEYQDILNNRSGGLTEDEKGMINMHPLIGSEMLTTSGVNDPVWLDCVLHHHEQWDGSGYPDGLVGGKIPQLAQILQVVDMFSARISVRSWGQKELANATIADLLRNAAGNKCNPQIIKALIKSIGAFPPGSRVQLANEENAIVVQRGQSATTPIVYSLSLNGRPLNVPIRRDTSIERFAIKALLPHGPQDTPLRLQPLWGIGLA